MISLPQSEFNALATSWQITVLCNLVSLHDEQKLRKVVRKCKMQPISVTLACWPTFSNVFIHKRFFDESLPPPPLRSFSHQTLSSISNRVWPCTICGHLKVNMVEVFSNDEGRSHYFNATTTSFSLALRQVC